jgi:2-methylisocitrate lyase-like PEP mutase family enzyme
MLSEVSERQKEKAVRFRALHEGEPFLIPNPWDAGSAKALETLGFKALATSSSAFAFTLGRPDGEAGLAEVVDHIAALDLATDLPVSVDLENGFGPKLDDAGMAIERAAEAGAVGGSIEDFDPDTGLYEFRHAMERVAAAVEAASRLDFPFTVTARAENHIRGNPDLDDTIRRLRAYEEMGADVLYAPGLRDAAEIRAVCEATTVPVNVLAHRGLTMSEIVAAGRSGSASAAVSPGWPSRRWPRRPRRCATRATSRPWPARPEPGSCWAIRRV